MAGNTKILIADDHQVVLEGLTKILKAAPDVEIVGLAQDGTQTLEQVDALNPDLIILDIAMPNLSGIEVVKRIRKDNEGTRILVFTMTANPEEIITLFGMGISGCILKDEPLEEVLLAVNTIQSGAVFYSNAVRQILQSHLTFLENEEEQKISNNVRRRIENLSKREKEIFLLLADGLTPGQIGERLYISPKTVETHKYNIMEKMDVQSTSDLIKIAVKYRLIHI
ncbi:MAG: response regulator transcription factor [Desulfobacterales bacterium]